MKKNKSNKLFIFVILLVGVGFAYISTNLTINGRSLFGKSDWLIYFDNVYELEGSNFASVHPTTSGNTTTSLNFEVNLPKPGDCYKFLVDVVNDGDLDAVPLIDIVGDNRNYVTYSVEYMDGIEISERDLLPAKSKDVIKVEVVYNEDIDLDTLTSDKESLSFTINLEYTKASKISNQRVKTAAYKLIENSVYPTTFNLNANETHNAYKFYHNATELTESTIDYRFIGNDPYNYVTFNDEMWRIVGVFYVDGEWKIKLIKDEALPEELMYNYEYTEDGYITASDNNWVTSKISEYLNSNFYSDLSYYSKNLVSESTFYLGGVSYAENVTADDLYSLERSHGPFYYPSMDRTVVGLLYPSDFAFTFGYGIYNDFYNDVLSYNARNEAEHGDGPRSWLDGIITWMISPSAEYLRLGTCLYDSLIGTNWFYPYGSDYDAEVHPVIYLNPNVLIFSGDGTSTNPYEFFIK